MNITGLDGLIQDIVVAFAVPIVGFVLFSLLAKATSRSKVNALVQRLSLVFVIVLFGYMISTLMFQDRAVLIAIWEQSPLVYSLVYTIVCFLVVACVAALVYWQLRPELWKRKQADRDEQG